jgi:hypothetical protein
MTISLARGFDRTIGVSGEPAAFHRTTSGVPGSGGARSKADIPTYDISGPEDLYTLNKRNRQLSSLSTSIAPLRLTTATLGEYQQRLSRAYAKPPSTLLQLGAREGVKLGAAKAAKYGIDKAFPGLLTQTMSLPPTYALSAPSAGASMTEVLKFASQPAGTAATGTTGLSAYSSFTSGAGAATTSGAGAATTGFSAGIGSTAAETLAMQSTRQTAVGLGGQTTTLSYSSFMSLGQQGGQTAFTAAQAPVLNVPSLTSKGMTQAVSQEAALAASDQAALAAASKGGTQGGTKVISSQTMAKANTYVAYIQIGYDVYRFIDEPSPATAGSAAGAVIGMYIGAIWGQPALGAAIGSFVGGFVGSLFGGGSKRYRRERQQRSFSGTAYGKSAFNTQRVQTATGGDNTTVLAVIEDDAYYHQGSGRYSQPITLPITTGNPQGFLDLEHRSAKELVQGLIGQNIDSGSGFGSAGRFLNTPPSSSLGARTIDMFLRKMGKTDKADEFKEEVFKHEGNFYDSKPHLLPHTIDRDFNFLGEDRLKGPSNSGASIQVFDNRFGITQDVIYGKAVAGRSGIEAQGEMYPTLGGQGSMVLQR